VFDRGTKVKARSSYRLLILDGHESHLTMDFIEYCDQNKILLAVYPSYPTHTLQPLDVAIFKPLSTAYSNEISAFIERSQGLTSMSKGDFFRLFYRAWKTSFKETMILKAFEATALSPFHPEVILKRFNTSPSSSDSESSALSASDWRKIERPLRQVVADQGNRQVKQLSQVLHSNSVQNALLEDEVAKLREALVNERMRRKRGKPLLLGEPKEYQGGAIFWSPRKVRGARDRQQLKEREEEQLQYQKAEANRHREELRQAKTREKEMRRQARAVTRLVKEKEKAEKAAEQASRAAARRTHQRLKQALKTSQKSKKHSLKAPIGATQKKRSIARPTASRKPQGAVPGAPALRSRRSRNITPSTRYQ
jgi:hypothetical protein